MNLRVPIKAGHLMNSWKSNDCSSSLYHGVNQTLYYVGDGHGQMWGTIMEFAWMAGGKPQKTSGSIARTWIEMCSPTSQIWSRSITHSISTFYLCFVIKLCTAQENIKHWSSAYILKIGHTCLQNKDWAYLAIGCWGEQLHIQWKINSRIEKTA
jgi:glycerol uptake facilitator-like aquaporin